MMVKQNKFQQCIFLVHWLISNGLAKEQMDFTSLITFYLIMITHLLSHHQNVLVLLTLNVLFSSRCPSGIVTRITQV